MALPLFRAEAIAHHRATIWGDMTLPVPPSLTRLTLFLCASLAISSGFLASGSYTRKAHALGFLAPQHGAARILAWHGGLIVALRVHEGQLVHRGDALLTIGTGETDSHGQDVDAAQLEGLRQQIGRIGDQIALEKQNAATRHDAIEAHIEALNRLVLALQAERAWQAQRAALAQADLGVAATLVRQGEMSALEQRRRQDNSLAQQQAESGTARAILDKQAEMAGLRAERAELATTTDERTGTLQNDAAERAGRIAAAEGKRAYQLTAPISGRISALQAWVGKPVEPGMPQMSILPEGDILQAALLVPPRAIGFIAPGQHVRLSYDSFPSQSFGFGQGVIETVSHTLLKPGEIAGPIAFDQPAYRVTVSLDSQSLHANGTDIALQTDTQLQADILLDRHSLFAWLTAPLRRAWGQP